MEMYQVRYFVALSEDLNFTRAAKRCNVSQPALTRAIRLLEEELGGPLIHRERANTRLTEFGDLMKPYLVEIVRQADAALQTAAVFSGPKRLRLGIMCTIAPKPVVALIKSMTDRHADVDLEITDATAEQIEALLQAGQLDVGLYCCPEHRDGRLHYIDLFRERLLVVLHPQHPLAAREALQLKELCDERYLNRINCEFNSSLAWERRGAVWKKAYRSERDDWILEMVANGMGFGFLPEFCINHPGVVARPIADADLTREVEIVTVRGRPHSAALGALVREARHNTWDMGFGPRQTS